MSSRGEGSPRVRDRSRDRRYEKDTYDHRSRSRSPRRDRDRYDDKDRSYDRRDRDYDRDRSDRAYDRRRDDRRDYGPNGDRPRSYRDREGDDRPVKREGRDEKDGQAPWDRRDRDRGDDYRSSRGGGGGSYSRGGYGGGGRGGFRGRGSAEDHFDDRRDYDRPLDRRAIEEGRRRREEERARGVVYTEDGAVQAGSGTASPYPENGDNKEETAEGEEDGEDDGMAAMMGFGGFGTTKNKGIGQNAEGAVKVNKQRTWRQYMNRRGGFNRPLEKMK